MHFHQLLHAGVAHHSERNPVHYFYSHTSLFLMPQKYSLFLASGLQKFRNPRFRWSSGICIANAIRWFCGLRSVFYFTQITQIIQIFSACGLFDFTQNRWSSESRGQIYLDYARSRQRKTKSNHGNHRNFSLRLKGKMKKIKTNCNLFRFLYPSVRIVVFLRRCWLVLVINGLRTKIGGNVKK